MEQKGPYNTHELLHLIYCGHVNKTVDNKKSNCY